MPYIKENRRDNLDLAIRNMILSFKANLDDKMFEKDKLTNEEFLNICGDINYAFSSILMGLMGYSSYAKIAMITGVLENVKQEYYRRIAVPYEENKKINNI